MEKWSLALLMSAFPHHQLKCCLNYHYSVSTGFFPSSSSVIGVFKYCFVFSSINFLVFLTTKTVPHLNSYYLSLAVFHHQGLASETSRSQVLTALKLPSPIISQNSWVLHDCLIFPELKYMVLRTSWITPTHLFRNKWVSYSLHEAIFLCDYLHFFYLKRNPVEWLKSKWTCIS